jgi:hypothetical protein
MSTSRHQYRFLLEEPLVPALELPIGLLCDTAAAAMAVDENFSIAW